MLKDMDCQRVPVEGNGHGDGGSFLPPPRSKPQLLPRKRRVTV